MREMKKKLKEQRTRKRTERYFELNTKIVGGEVQERVPVECCIDKELEKVFEANFCECVFDFQ